MRCIVGEREGSLRCLEGDILQPELSIERWTARNGFQWNRIRSKTVKPQRPSQRTPPTSNGSANNHISDTIQSLAFQPRQLSWSPWLNWKFIVSICLREEKQQCTHLPRFSSAVQSSFISLSINLPPLLESIPSRPSNEHCCIHARSKHLFLRCLGLSLPNASLKKFSPSTRLHFWGSTDFWCLQIESTKSMG